MIIISPKQIRFGADNYSNHIQYEDRHMIHKITKIYNIIEENVTNLLLFSAVSLVFISILMRYVFRAPIPWADELYTIIFAWSMTLGYSVAVRDDAHIKMDAIDMIIKSPRLRLLLDVVSLVFSLIFSWILCYYGFLAMMLQYDLGRVTPTLLIPRYIIYSIIPFTVLIMTIRYLGALIKAIQAVISSVKGGST